MIKPEELDEFVRTSRPGDSFVYYFGDLAFDRLIFQHSIHAEDRNLHVIGGYAWLLHDMKLVSLVQRRIGERGTGRFQYIMQRR